jgi:uncharacterized damage-inducible protein DinB
MTEPDPADPRVDPPGDGDEATQLHGFLDYHRDTLFMKTAGLDQQQLARPHPPSALTLAGLLKHMALVEDNWFSVMLHGNDDAEQWRGVDWESDPDWEFRTARSDDPDELRAMLHDAIGRSRELVAGLPLDTMSKRRRMYGNELVSLRWIVLHMIEEYARHNGHADLIRESIDGSVGE